MIRLSSTAVSPFAGQVEIDQIRPQLEAAHELLRKGRGPGCEYLGWLDLPSQYDKAELARIRQAAGRIRRDSDVLVVIGIGGSYLGARAAIEMLSHSFQPLLSKRQRKAPLVLFAGNNLSPDYLNDLFDVLEGKRVSVNVISKSGTTTEPAIAFRIFKRWMEERYGREGARSRIYATTDRARGVLRRLADEEGYESFVVPDDIGGRFSVLTAVGLLPIAVAGIDVRDMLRGARDGAKEWQKPDPDTNPCYAYAAWRNILLRKGYEVEIMVNYEPSLHFFTEWWKQLFGESEGKNGRGILPAGVDNTTDLHSMGQYIQDGRRLLFETVLQIEKSGRPLPVPEDPENRDGLNFLAGLDLAEVNEKAAQGTVLAHVDGGVPNLKLTVTERSAYSFGQLVYFFELACAISGYLLAVNPFDQPGVENYKQNMYALLGKPGFEQRRAELESRLAEADQA
jgi:glucose-6-phosphate isomerase